MKHKDFNASIEKWYQLEGIDHLSLIVLAVDREKMIVDALFKFAANQQIVLHRHLALNHLLVIQGEHILYEPDGTVKEVRSTASYTVSPGSDEPHREGGGAEEDVIILFSIRGTTGVMYEILDDDQNIVGTLSMDDFEAQLAAQAS